MARLLWGGFLLISVEVRGAWTCRIRFSSEIHHMMGSRHREQGRNLLERDAARMIA